MKALIVIIILMIGTLYFNNVIDQTNDIEEFSIINN